VIAIPLTRDQIAIIDDEDADLVDDGWYTLTCRSTSYTIHYACRQAPSPGGRRALILLHRVILERMLGRKLERADVVDHINLDGLDNSRSNLRLASNQENQRNKRVTCIRKSSHFKGVTWHKHTGKWQARIAVNKQSKYLGVFKTEEEAAKAYDIAAIQLFNEFALLNFPVTA
jgi:hypothetical protein